MRHLTRRAFGAAFVVGLGTVPGGSAAQTTGNATFTVVDFFGQEPRSWEAVIGYPHAEYKHLAGSAASASTRRLPGDLGLKPVVRATWQLIWTAPGPQAAAELAHCDSGFANYTQFAELRPRVWQAPDIQSQDVTAGAQCGDRAATPQVLGVPCDRERHHRIDHLRIVARARMGVRASTVRAFRVRRDVARIGAVATA